MFEESAVITQYQPESSDEFMAIGLRWPKVVEVSMWLSPVAQWLSCHSRCSGGGMTIGRLAFP